MLLLVNPAWLLAAVDSGSTADCRVTRDAQHIFALPAAICLGKQQQAKAFHPTQFQAASQSSALANACLCLVRHLIALA
jgi:hypothetical protein